MNNGSILFVAAMMIVFGIVGLTTHYGESSKIALATGSTNKDPVTSLQCTPQPEEPEEEIFFATCGGFY